MEAISVDTRRNRARGSARAAWRTWPEVIGGAVGAGVGVGLPFILSSNPSTGWLIAGAIIGALFGTALPPAFAYANAFLSYDRYVLGERVARIESKLDSRAWVPERPSAEEAALREFVWQLRSFEKKAVVLRDSAGQEMARTITSGPRLHNS